VVLVPRSSRFPSGARRLANAWCR